jgi:hypothetical protein
MGKLKVGAITYSIVESSIPDYGSIDYETQTISIRKGLAKDARDVTLWHEVIHAIMYNMGHVNHDEIIVDGIAHGVLQCLRDNPQLRGGKHG